MIDPTPKTLNEHREYLHEIVRLKLFFLVSWLKDHPDESFSSALRQRVDIYRKTDANPEALNPKILHFDEEPWLSMENKTYEIYQREKNDPAAFERLAFAVFRPSIDARCERDYSDSSVLSHYQCGSLRHETALSPDGETLSFHIANSVMPHSIFDDPEHLKQCFGNLLDIAEKIFHAKRISTHSWLNSNPKWLSLFPEEWARGAGPVSTDIQWHYGFWGQFITARGTFNWKYGEILRKTGKFPFLPCFCTCSIDAMRDKLPH